MAIIQPGAPKAEKAIQAPKGAILGASRKESAQVGLKQEKSYTHLIPVQFIALTAVLMFICITTLAVLLDVSDSLKTQALQARMSAAKRSFRKLFVSDIVQDSVAFESRVSLVSSQPKRSYTVQRQKVDGSITRQTVRYQSPQNLMQQVLRIIHTSNKKQLQARRLAAQIVSESLRQNYDPLFVAAVIKSESAFNELAVSNKGAQGLMQIMPATGKYLEKSASTKWPTAVRLTDAGYNIHLGVKYLKELEGMFDGNRLLTLIAYNWGPGKLDRAIRSKRGVPAECLRYALKILKDHKLWNETSITS